VGILDEAIREIGQEKQAAEDELRQALEDFDIITSRAIFAVKNMVAALRTELLAAGWWAGELSEDANQPHYVRLGFEVRRYGDRDPHPVTNPSYSYAIKFDGLGGAERTTGDDDPLTEMLVLRGVARQDFGMDLEKDLKLFLKAILRRH
jgi:hypothetical protein